MVVRDLMFKSQKPFKLGLGDPATYRSEDRGNICVKCLVKAFSQTKLSRLNLKQKVIGLNFISFV